jgi:hypothetical protein
MAMTDRRASASRGSAAWRVLRRSMAVSAVQHRMAELIPELH